MFVYAAIVHLLLLTILVDARAISKHEKIHDVDENMRPIIGERDGEEKEEETSSGFAFRDFDATNTSDMVETESNDLFSCFLCQIRRSHRCSSGPRSVKI